MKKWLRQHLYPEQHLPRLLLCPLQWPRPWPCPHAQQPLLPRKSLQVAQAHLQHLLVSRPPPQYPALRRQVVRAA